MNPDAPIPWYEWLYIGMAIHPCHWKLYAIHTCCGENRGFELSLGPLRLFGSIPWRQS